MQVIGLFSEEISDISVRMKDILKAQEIQLVQLDEMGTFENNDGYSYIMYICFVVMVNNSS